jgi:hypothetical protein
VLYYNIHNNNHLKKGIEIMSSIKYFSVEEENKYRTPVQHFSERKSIKMLGIKGEAAAVLLQRVISNRSENCRYTDGGRYRSGHIVGGGLFVQTNAKVFINSSGEVGLFFTETLNGGNGVSNTIRKFLRVAQGEAELLKAIKDKLANELKSMWKGYSKYLNLHNVITIQAETKNEVKSFEYSENDYRVLYEVLKGRNMDKLQGKYSKETFDKMIGNKIDDQFIISATELIKVEIAKLVEQRDAEIKEMEEAHRIASNNLWKAQKEEKEQLTNSFNDKIKEFEDQIGMLVYSSNMAGVFGMGVA